jgi:hypothetical protein
VTRAKWGMYGKSTDVNDKVSGKNLSGPVIIEKARYETFRNDGTCGGPVCQPRWRARLVSNV